MKKIKTSFLNVASSVIANSTAIVANIVTQRVFIKTLGIDTLGINGVFTNIITMLGIAELGISHAIIFNLYRPLIAKDNKKIIALMHFYKKAYSYISKAILAIGIIMIPFVHTIIGDNTTNIDITFAFILAVIDIYLSYFLSYRRSILYADKKNYIINFVHAIYLTTMNALQVLVLLLLKNYYMFILIRMICRILENIVIYSISNKKYPYLNKRKKETIDELTKKDIITKIKALFLHKIAGFVVSGTDNIVISMFLGVTSVGYYSNYNTIVVALTTVLSQAIYALIPNVGHILVKGNPKENYVSFRKVRILNALLSTMSAISLYLLAEPFISMWVGDEYLMHNTVLIVLTVNYFQQTMRSTYLAYKEAAGIFYEDRFMPIIESIVNIVVSIILVNIIGIEGVFVGTFASSLVLWLYSYPKYVYKKLFERSYLQYFCELLGYSIPFALMMFAAIIMHGIIY